MSRKRSSNSNSTSQPTPNFSNPYNCLLEAPCSKGHSRNCQTNPTCLYGMGEGKEGIWSKKPAMLHSIESYPPMKPRVGCDIRVDYSLKPAVEEEHPVGLINLGATCYLNVLLQSLFNCLPFRKAIYDYPGSGKAEGTNGSLILEIQRVFGRLDPRNIAADCDVTDLVNLLGFDRGYQQDPFECWKLLGSTIDNGFQETNDPELMQVFNNFRGRQKYITTCSKCGNSREREEAIEELQVQIRGNKTVSEGLYQYVSEEDLTGDSRYHCETCQERCDAKRRVVITELPQVLWVQLLRYEYNSATNNKEKLIDCITMEKHLEMDQFFKCELPSPGYDLVSVIEHQGVGAHNGHYVARNRDWMCEQRWWLLDDNKVSSDSMKNAVSVVDSESDSAQEEEEEEVPLKKKSKTKNNSRKSTSTPKKGRGRKATVKDGIDQLQQLTSSQGSRRSKDCYVLVYVSQGCLEGATIPVPPQHICDEIALRNKHAAKLIQDHEAQVESLKATIEARKKWYVDSYSSLIPKSESDDFVLVEADWLKQWVTGVPKCSVLDENGEVMGGLFEDLPSHCSSLVCTHSNQFSGHASPQQVSTLKKVKLSGLKNMLLLHHSSDAVDAAVSSLLSGNTESAWYVQCTECANSFSKSREQDEVKETLAVRVMTGVDEGGPFVLSKTWFTLFKNDVVKKDKGGMSDFVTKDKQIIDPEVNTKIICPHGGLMPNTLIRSISNDGWHALRELYPRAIEVKEQERCTDCMEVSRGVSGMRKEDKQKRAEHLSGSLGKFFRKSKPTSLREAIASIESETREYMLVNTFFIHRWRNWVNGDGDANSPPQCEVSPVEDLQCACGSIALPLNFDEKAMELPLDETTVVGYELLESAQYQELMVRCDCAELAQVTLKVYPKSTETDKTLFEWSPQPCRECMGVALKNWERESYSFTNQTLNITVLSEGAPVPNEGLSTTSRPRRSRRSGAASVVCGVSSIDLVGLLKMKIWQTVGDEIEPHKVDLWVGSTLLDNDDRTLASFGINAHSAVIVRPLAHSTGDMQSYFKYTGTSHVEVAPELGFKNTLLSGSGGAVDSCPSCTFKNNKYSNWSICEMCKSNKGPVPIQID